MGFPAFAQRLQALGSVARLPCGVWSDTRNLSANWSHLELTPFHCPEISVEGRRAGLLGQEWLVTGQWLSALGVVHGCGGVLPR